jgi:galactose-1-phosphate uridylyltransferase
MADDRMKLDREVLEQVLERRTLEEIQVNEMFNLFRKDDHLYEHAPDALCQIDPRDGALIIYNTKRAKRPHDNKPGDHGEGAAAGGGEGEASEGAAKKKACPVCDGKTTKAVDVEELTEGFTFINKNLFPVLFPPDYVKDEWLTEPLYPDPSHQGRVSYGLHFLQWTSNYHDRDWQNMPQADRVTVLRRLAALEKKLLYDSDSQMPPSTQWRSQKETSGFVEIIKNYGAAVGGSLEHGHQQIGWSNIMPRSFYNNWEFFIRHKHFFSEYMLKENPKELEVYDYGEAVLLVPYFMKRPYNMMLIVKDVGKQYLCEMTEGELMAVADGIHDAIVSILDIMPRMGKETAYNMVVHNGPGAGLYFEFLPYTQETGGFEHLGLWVCQGNTRQVVDVLRRKVQELNS